MSAIYRRYFEVTDADAIDGARAVVEQVEELRGKAMELAEEFGFERAAFMTHAHLGVSLTGFTGPTGRVVLVEWRKDGRTAEGHDIYVPRRATKAGKARVERMKIGRVDEQRALKGILGLEKFADVWGSIGPTGYGVHYAVAVFVDGDRPAVLVSLPFEEVDAELPIALRHAVELTEHKYRARFAARATANPASR